jgi:NADPH:quinone reductase-like Zn-dependent oxidoreductase
MVTMTIPDVMKAARIHSFGGPEVVAVEDVALPRPKPDEVLVRVHAAGVNPVDWKIREGHLGDGPLPQTLGSDLSGVVEVPGSSVKDFRTGDAVFGTVADESGSYAEYALASAAQVARKPASLDDVHAAAMPIACLTAWQALFDHGHLQAGQKVLIHAAAGGVGGFAVQFAKFKEAHVIGTASGQSLEYVRSLGADEVIDYRSTRFEDAVSDADLVIDTIGGETQARSWKVLRRGGVLVSTVQPPDENAAAQHGVRGLFMVCDLKRNDQLARIADLVVRELVKVKVETVLPLIEARKGLDLSQSGHTHGKIVLSMEPSPA